MTAEAQKGMKTQKPLETQRLMEPQKLANLESEQIVALCTTETTCANCITSHPSCAWCKKENYTEEGKSMCDTITSLQQSQCVGNIVHPTNQRNLTKSKPLRGSGVGVDEVVQLAPQELRLKLRPRDPFKLDVKFRLAEDYPVDLYYLMDLSKSMEDDKDKLASLGNLLAEQMVKITRNFRLGFGSFVDKTVMPYVSTVKAKLEQPCTGCAAPYGFKNHMPLNESTDQFAKEVHDARVSGNLDAPEGGFDAIMQSIVCGSKIGWRPKSRKMLVFSTDSGFHYAGDGKLGGIVTPNDGICHLDDNGYYTESTVQDYPSLSQLRHKISEMKVNIIFAVTAGQVSVYRELSKNLEGAYTGQLENDSSNVVQLVRDQYEQITSEVELKDNASSNVIVTYYSKCLGNKLEKTNVCKGLKIGTNVEFSAEIEVKSCPENRTEWSQTFHISPVGLNEALVVHLDMICQCDCEQPDKVELSSPKCSNAGTYECGICKCDSNVGGRFCECDADSVDTEGDERKCIKENSTLICSGRGICSCGVCKCHVQQNPTEIVRGTFCECDNFSCDRHANQICGGEQRGKCECGKCFCQPGFKGPACACPVGDDDCKGPNGVVCSGKGVCDCGVCLCNDKYSGPHCEDCPTCTGKCAEYRACVQCQAFGTGELKDNCNCSFKIEKKPEVKIEKNNEGLCIFKDDDDCKFTFVYRYEENKEPEVRVQETKECPPPINILAIILGVIGGIVAVGLCLLIIWKLLTTIHDRREFAKFEKERQMAKWDAGENPIYKQATSTFKNPTYGGKQ